MKTSLFSLCLRDERVVVFNQPAIMGVVNVSPNSFYNPHTTVEAVLKTAEKMVSEGADILDVGGEATNPSVNLLQDGPSLQQELELVQSTVAAIKQRFDVLVSVDTSRAAVMQAAVAAGADVINDQRALADEAALRAAVELKVPVCLMHFFHPSRQPGSTAPASLLATIKNELMTQVNRVLAAGVSSQRIIVDPGFGQGNYGKNAAENYYLLHHLSAFLTLGYPVLSGWSRKSMIGDILQVPPAERLFGSVAADSLAVYNGAAIIRTHDVKASSDAMKVAWQVRQAKLLLPSVQDEVGAQDACHLVELSERSAT